MRIICLVACLLLFAIPSACAQSLISTVIEVDIYGSAKISHSISLPMDEVMLQVYEPESLSINPNTKFAINNGILTVKNVSDETSLLYYSSSLASKNKQWNIRYQPLQAETVKIVLPFNAKILSQSAGSLQSKDRIGQMIEWDSTQDASIEYTLVKEDAIDFRLPFYLTLAGFIVVAILFVRTIIAPRPTPKAEKFIERIKGIKRIIVRQVIYAILVLAYSKNDNNIDQSKIRGVMKDIGVSDASNHKGEIHTIVKSEIDFLIINEDSKIRIRPSAEKEYNLRKNAKRIINKMDKLVGKKNNYGM
jgi:hypothetical protein